MELAILLSLAASFCTATSSICQRLGARHLESGGHQGVATGVSWGFIAAVIAVIKELSSHVDGGPAAIFGTWSVYVLMATGAAVMLLTSHAMAAGPLAASQPGFTLGDPLTAILLGAFMFSERLQTTPPALAAALLGLAVLAVGVWILSRSHLITAHAATRPAGTSGRIAERELTRRSWR